MKPAYLFEVITKIFSTVITLVFCQTALAQQAASPALPDTAKMTYNQISQSLKLYVYPSKNQTNLKQKEEEFECYKWAVAQSGIDPLNLPKVEAAAAPTGPTGAGVKGAAKGAVAGAAVGAITGDAGEGAGVGAVAGGVAGRRKGKKAQAQAGKQSQEQASSKEQEMKDSFKKAFSVCIEGKGYTIK